MFDRLPTPCGLVRARRRARPPEDQVGLARLREDRRATRLPLLRQRRGRPRHHPRRAADALRRGDLRGRRADRSPLGIPGEDLPGLVAGHRLRRLVQRPPRLPRPRVRPLAQRAVVIGNGNVAIDVRAHARADAPRSSRETDTADHAIEALAGRPVRRSSSSAGAAPPRRRSPRPSCANSVSWRAPTSIVDPASSSSTRRARGARGRSDRGGATSPSARIGSARTRRASRDGSSCASCVSPVAIIGTDHVEWIASSATSSSATDTASSRAQPTRPSSRSGWSSHR